MPAWDPAEIGSMEEFYAALPDLAMQSFDSREVPFLRVRLLRIPGIPGGITYAVHMAEAALASKSLNPTGKGISDPGRAALETLLDDIITEASADVDRIAQRLRDIVRSELAGVSPTREWTARGELFVSPLVSIGPTNFSRVEEVSGLSFPLVTVHASQQAICGSYTFWFGDDPQLREWYLGLQERLDAARGRVETCIAIW
jgi:hypothetical protein